MLGVICEVFITIPGETKIFREKQSGVVVQLTRFRKHRNYPPNLNKKWFIVQQCHPKSKKQVNLPFSFLPLDLHTAKGQFIPLNVNTSFCLKTSQSCFSELNWFHCSDSCPFQPFGAPEADNGIKCPSSLEGECLFSRLTIS